MKKMLFAIALFALCFSCKDANDDVVKEVNKDGSIETVLQVTHDGNHDLLISKQTVWVKGQRAGLIVHVDTIPRLGEYTDTTENENGDQVFVKMQRQFEFYITVK